MLDDMLGAYGNRLTIAVIGVAVGFLCLILVLWLIRRRGGPAPFLRGGKNRQPRLQVLDAAAVDARRRLVLVRRDDVEHLIMIGGPTDIVIESSIVDGRSPPYHTLMKTVSEPEPAALAADEQPQTSDTGRLTQASGIAAPAASQHSRPTKQVAVDSPAANHETFAWAGASQPSTQAEPASAVRAASRLRDDTPPSTRLTSSIPETTASVAPPVEDVPEPAPKPLAPHITASPTVADPAALATPVAAPVVSVSSTARAPAEPAPLVRSDDFSVSSERATASQSPLAATPSSLDTASGLLDAARERVFQPAAPRPQVTVAPIAQTVSQRPAAVAPAAQAETTSPFAAPATVPVRQPAPVAAAPAKPLGSDFERILEEEMASNLAASPAMPIAGTPNPISPTGQTRRDPAMARVTGATPEPALQNEIARIFGEMSVTRDDR